MPRLLWVEPKQYANKHIKFIGAALAEALLEMGEDNLHAFGYPHDAHHLALLHSYSVIVTESDLPNYPQYLEAGNEFQYDGRTGLFLLKNSIRDKYSENRETPVIFLNFQGKREMEEQIRKYPPVSIYGKGDFDAKPLATSVKLKNKIIEAMAPGLVSIPAGG